jgi:hypothetical protein
LKENRGQENKEARRRRRRRGWEEEEEEVGREEGWAVLKVEEMGYQLWFFDSLLRNLLLL